MAEAAILAALKMLGKALASQLVKQATSQASGIASTISDLESRMNRIRIELRVIRAYIDQIDIHNESNGPLRVWIEEVQNAADTIKGLMDEFIYMVDNERFGGVMFYFKKLFKEPNSFVALKQIASRLEIAEKSLEHLREVKERWIPTTNIGTGNGTNNAIESSIQLAISAHFIDEDEIIGFGDATTNLTSLINSDEPHLNVISVWGMPGVGKTTLVTNVFKRERDHFDCNAWICISQTYKIDQVLRNLIYEICKSDRTNPINTNNMDMRELTETIRSLLQHRKYLIVLDDAWDQNSILNIQNAFVENRKGSRIIITSRMVDVASLARESNRLELKPLPIEEAWNLFCRKAFQGDRNHECPPHLHKWAKQIFSRCDGLPLAIVSIGIVLFSCANREYEWKQINDQLSWELENNKSLDRLRSILKLSFDYLPSHLKKCFLYCSMFPEDYLLPRKKLIRLWIAEGFVDRKGECTLEETGESYLVELVNRSMLQLAKKNFSGRVKRCRMHDTLRELAISLSVKANFCFPYGENKVLNIDKSVCRLSIIKSGNDIDHHVQLPALRTLISFDLSMHSCQFISTNLVKCRCLTVLDLENLSIESVPDNIGDLFNLCYLGMRRTNVRLLPNSIHKLHNLQTLDLSLSRIHELPDSIVQLTQLRHLFAESIRDDTACSLKPFTGIKLPIGMFYLKEIRTIQAVESNSTVVRELGNLTQLRSLRIWEVKANHCAELCKSLSKMSSLSYLSINASNENEILHLEGLELPRFEKLRLNGRLRESTLNSPLFQTSGEGIQYLQLGWSQLQNNPLPYLSQLRNLTTLSPIRSYEGQQLIFQQGWFLKLKHLFLGNMPNLINVKMESGTMVNVEHIYLGDLKQLAEIPTGMEHLISLKQMFIFDMPANFGGLAKGSHRLFHFSCIVH